MMRQNPFLTKLNIFIVIKKFSYHLQFEHLSPEKLSMLRLHLSEVRDQKNLWKQTKPCHIGIHWKALSDEYQYDRISVMFQLLA